MKRKILSLLLGTIATLVLFEVGLGLSYKAFVAWQHKENSEISEADEGEIRILAIGESTTAVAGDGTGQILVTSTAYPAQLQRILNERQSNVRFRVLNNGIMGGDTAGTLDMLEPAIDEFEPDLIIAMMGIKDKAGTTPSISLAPSGWIQNLHLAKLASWVHESFWLRETERPFEISSLEDLPESLRPGKAHLVKYIRESRMTEGASELDAIDDLTVSIYLWYIGRHRRAETLLRETIDTYDVGYNVLARVLATDGRRAEADALLEKAIAEHPSESMYRVTLAELYTEEKRFEDAERLLVDATTSGQEYMLPNRAEVYLAMAQASVALAKGDAAGSLALLESVEPRRGGTRFFLPPQSFVWSTSMGETHAALENWDQAKEHLERAVQQHPKYAATMWSLAKVYRKTGEIEKEEALRRKVLADTERVADYFELAKLFMLQGEAERIPSLFDEAVAMVPSLRTSHEQLYEVAESRGIALMVMQYPSFSLEMLHKYAEVRSEVIYIDNEFVFAEDPDGYFYEPRFPHAFSHYTLSGSKVLGAHVADHVMDFYELAAQ
jgi:tetratricopeptide (TPR) repeat protein